jgi:hypothetical protein
MFKNSNSDSDTEIRQTCNRITFREVPLVNLFKKIHEPTKEEGFYSGEEEKLFNDEHSDYARAEEEKTE